MTEYRVYTLSNGNHIMAPPDIIACETDQEAIEQARRLIEGHDVEVWQGARCVIRMKPTVGK
jgi:hypothetical protein